MTYCVGILLREGLVLAADSRTNAGVDYISIFRKMTVFETPGERFVGLMSAGNLATTQAVVSLINEHCDAGTPETSIFQAPNMFHVARIVGNALRDVIAADGPHVRMINADPSASFIVGGQIQGREPRLFNIYSAGNFIEATPETPFVQIGETKYGKPILDRMVDFDMPIHRAAKAALISFDSTMRSNLSVAPPIDLVLFHRDRFEGAQRYVVAEDDAYFNDLRRRYGQGLVRLFDRLPEPQFGDGVLLRSAAE